MPCFDQTPNGVRIRLKAVPGASRDAIAGLLADRLKVRVSAPPEGGRANKAIIDLLAKTLRISSRDIEIIQGATNPEKVALVREISADDARRLLGIAPNPE